MRKPIILLLVAAACALIAWMWPGTDADERLGMMAARMQERTASRHAALQEFAGDLLAGASSRSAHHNAASIHWWVLDHDTLVAWSGTSRFFTDSLAHGTALHYVNDGNVLLRAVAEAGPRKVLALEGIWSRPPFSNAYLRPAFAPWVGAASGVIAATDPGIGPVVRDPAGVIMFRLETDGSEPSLSAAELVQLLLKTVVIIAIIAAAWLACRAIARPWIAVSVFAATIAMLRYASLGLYPIPPFDRLALFGPELYAASSWLPSLGDLLINAALLMVMARFVHLRLRGAAFSQGAPGALMLFVSVAALLFLGWWITSAFIGLVEDSSVDLDLFHLQDLNGYSALALVCMALLFGAWALVCDAVVRMVPKDGSRGRMLLLAGGAIVLSVLVHDHFGIVDMILVLWPVPMLVIAVLGRQRRYDLWHAISGLGIVAVLGAHVLIKYTERRSVHERMALAERLVTSEDPVVELLFGDAAPRLRRDAHVYALLRDTAGCSAADLDSRVRQEYFTGYWERYDVRLFAFGPDGALRCATSSEPPRSLADGTGAFSRTIAAVDMPELFIDAVPGERSFYHARVAVMAADTTPPAQLVIELHPRFSAEVSGFPELLLNDRDGLSRRIGRYPFARYEAGTLMEQRGGTFPMRWDQPPGDGPLSQLVVDGMDMVAYGDAARSLVVLATPVLRWIDRATLFSWLFTFLGLALAFAMIGRGLLRWAGPPVLGIGWKVRIALLTFTVLGLAIFSVGAQRLFSELYGERNDAALLGTSRSVAVELQHKLDGVEQLAPERSAYLQHLLVKFSNVFFTDINLYGLDGALLATSRSQVFDAGLLGRRMHAAAFVALSAEARSEFVHDERIGMARFRSAYLPLRDAHGHMLAFVNIPSFSRQGELDRERGALFTAIVNLFVLLLALSLLAGIFISGWTTRPLELLKRGLSRMALRGTDEPLAYGGRDEVGELVRVYNRKVEELRESAEKLARSERESAWREMARQVAHEIKNPLTPMRLSVQHFERTWDPDAPDAKEKLERFTGGMVQQVDALSRIAGEFSAFAQMPQPQETVFDLREVAKAGVALFAGETNADVVLEANEPLMVKADRDHLLRALNNLLKNALQSIPEGRHGSIEVKLARDGDRALLSVKDNGSGIPAEARERIFTPSFTTKNSGMGLGLAMVKRIVEQAGGSVRFETRVGEGTAFFITLKLHGVGGN